MNSIRQCDKCSAALTEGWCEMKTALEEEYRVLCFDCALVQLHLKRLLEEDDLAAATGSHIPQRRGR